MLDDPYPKIRPGPPRPSRIIQPAQFSMPKGTERYVVQGAGAVLIPVEAGDHVTVINDEGGQVCEIVSADAMQSVKDSILDRPADAPADGLRALLTGNDQSLRGLRMGLDARKIDLAPARAVRLFDAGTRAKADEAMRVTRDGSLIIAAPGGAMDAEAQDTTTPLTVMIRRATIKSH
ncbi:MAG: aminomethyltransferase, partial [Pseudomonadota bacterium]